MPNFAGLRGLDRAKAQLRAFQNAFPDRVGEAMRMECEVDMTESKRRCPVDVSPNPPHPGQLRASGRVHPPERSGRKITVVMAYGTDYAVYVHEDPDALHPVGEWKFLESVIKESSPHMSRRIAERYRRNGGTR